MFFEINSNKCKCKNLLKDSYGKVLGIIILIFYCRYLFYWISVSVNIILKLGNEI